MVLLRVSFKFNGILHYKCVGFFAPYSVLVTEKC